MWFFIKCQRPALKLATDHKRTQLHNDMVAVAVLYVFVCVCEWVCVCVCVWADVWADVWAGGAEA